MPTKRTKKLAVTAAVAAVVAAGITPLAQAGEDHAGKAATQSAHTQASQHEKRSAQADPKKADPKKADSKKAGPKGEDQFEFTEKNTAIRTDSTQDSKIVGHGNPGDGATKLDGENGESVQCKGHERPDIFYLKVRDNRTGVEGWSVSCYLEPNYDGKR